MIAALAATVARGVIAADRGGVLDLGDAQRNGLGIVRSARGRRPSLARPGQPLGRGTRLIDCGMHTRRRSGGRPPPGRNLPGRAGPRRIRDRRSGDLSRTRRHRADRSARGRLHGRPVRRLADCRRRLFCHGFGPDAGRRRQTSRLFERIGHRERPTDGGGGVGSNRVSAGSCCSRDLARRAGVEPDRLTLLAAPTASLAGTVQVVARSVETALAQARRIGFRFERELSAAGARLRCRPSPAISSRRWAAPTTRFFMAAK